MDLFKLVKVFLADPANLAVLLYAIAALFLMVALVFVLTGRRKKIIAKHRSVVMERNNGVVITGNVRGHVETSVNAPNIEPAPKASPTVYWLNVLATMSAIASAVFTALAYLLPKGTP